MIQRISALFSILSLTIIIPASVHANSDLEKSIAICAAKSGTLTKVACYDKIAEDNGLVEVMVSKSTKSTGKWIVDSSSNPIDDSKTATAMLKADSGKGSYGDSIFLILRCKSNKTEAYIDWESFMGMDAVRVTSRVGSADATTTNWSSSSDNKAAFAPRAIPFIKSMLGQNKFVAQATPYSENPITAIFDIAGIGSATQDIRDICKW